MGIVGRGKQTYIIAEGGIGHCGDVGLGKRIIDQVKAAGADAVKFQFYVTDSFLPKVSKLYDVYSKCELSVTEMEQLRRYADDKHLGFGLSVFSPELYRPAMDMDLTFHKVASSEIWFDRLFSEYLEKLESYHTVFYSLGMVPDEMTAAKIIQRFNDLPAFTYPFYCVSLYPPNPPEMYMQNIRYLHKLCQVGDIGYSDHGQGAESWPAVLAIGYGVDVIEKHVLLDRVLGLSLPMPDEPVSANLFDPVTGGSPFAEYVKRVRQASQAAKKIDTWTKATTETKIRHMVYRSQASDWKRMV